MGKKKGLKSPISTDVSRYLQSKGSGLRFQGEKIVSLRSRDNAVGFEDTKCPDRITEGSMALLWGKIRISNLFRSFYVCDGNSFEDDSDFCVTGWR